MEHIVLSLTSYLPRFPTLPPCLASLFSQTVTPDKIILYLDEDVSLDQLPIQVLAFQKRGLEIRATPYCLKSHTKYFFAMQEYPGSIIITVDDDALYEHNLVKNLIRSYQNFPEAVSAGRVHRIRLMSDGRPAPYLEWQHECTNLRVPSHELLATGVGGVLYPPACFGQDAFNRELLLRLSPCADDLWLKVMELRYNIPVVYAEQNRKHPKTIPGSQENALYLKNRNEGRNDRYFHQLLNHYQMNIAALFSTSH